MAKRRYSAAKIARTPSLKRKLAEILADYFPGREQVSLTQMLVYGHRGYISYSEDELCKMFDKLYSSELEKVEERRKELQALSKQARSWEKERIDHELSQLDSNLKRFEDLSAELFEKEFL